MTVQDDDQLLVCRNSTPYNLKTQNLMAELLDDDLMLVCRSGTPYKATGLEIKESIGPQEAPPSLTSATLVDDNPTGADRYSNSSFTTTLNWATKGVPEASVEMQATVTGELDIAGATDEIVGITSESGALPYIQIDTTVDPPVDVVGTLRTDNSTAIFADAPANNFGITKCYQFDGDGSKYNQFTGQFTIPDQYTLDYYLYSSGMAASGRPIDINGSKPLDDYGHDGGRSIRLRSTDESTNDYDYDIDPNKWYHIRVTNTGIWVNGTLKYSNPRSMAGYACSKWNMGKYGTSTNYPWIGYLGPARLLSEDAGAPPAGGLVLTNGKFAGPNTTLTLASDANLASGAFKAGDAVKQNNSPVVPTSSAITNVANSPGTNIPDDFSAYDLKPVLDAMGITSISGVKLEPGSPGITDYTAAVFYWKQGTTDFGSVPGFNSSYVIVQESVNIPNGGGNYLAGNMFVDDGGSNYAQDINSSIEVTFDAISTSPSIIISANDFGDSDRAAPISVKDQDGNWRTINRNTTTLTLTNSNGLSDFAVGDVVQGSGKSLSVQIVSSSRAFYTDTGVEITDAPAATDVFSSQNYYNTNLNDSNKTGNKGLAVFSNGDTIVLNYTVPSAGTTIQLIGGAAAGIAGPSQAVTLAVTGDVVAGNLVFASTTADTKEGLPKVSQTITTTATTGTITIAMTAPTSTGGSFIQYVEGIEAMSSITAISESTPSITTDGGTWTVGDVVTGPPTDITAIYVSADAAAKTMTVSDVVGPWSANTGNYVVNTVVNPVLIKPETSAIAVVGSTNVATKVDILEGIGNNIDSQPVFVSVIDKGDTTTAWATLGNVTYTQTAGSGGTIGYWYSNDLVNWSRNSSTNWGGPQSLTGGADSRYQAFNAGGLATPIGDSAVVGTCTFSNPSINLVLIDSASILTLTDDTDLNQFATGDNIYAAGVAPASFATVLYTANAGVQAIANVGLKPDLVWTKTRDAAYSHMLYDSIRGVNNKLSPDLNNSAITESGTLTSFDADGFTLGPNDNSNYINGARGVAWCWSASDTTVTNNEGTIPSQVRSNGNFSVVSYTGNATIGSTVGHGLNSDCVFIIAKNRDSSSGWPVYTTTVGASNSLELSSANTPTLGTGIWGSINPTDSVFTVGGDTHANGNNDRIIAYCWAESPTQGFGEYTGSGASGNQIDVGFEPAFVMIKCTTDNANWFMLDNKRGGAAVLNPNTNGAEAAGTDMIEFNSTGFNIVTSTWEINYAGRNFIYAAFASAGGPSGVVGDITGLDMTLSESTGTWEVGQKVTMDEKPAVVSTANVIFDQTGAVSGISTLPVAGQLILDKDTPKLTFTTPGTGQTWDEELPAGTKLQTSFVATNTEGSSSATSNVVTPGVTTLLAMGQTTTNKEELAQTIVQMETFDERKAIVTGEAAKSKIKGKAEAAQNKVEAAQNESKKAGL